MGARPTVCSSWRSPCTAVGGPASAIGFAIARDYSTPALVGTASGLVNVGGFSAAIIGAVGVGRMLDYLGAEDAAAFQWAFLIAIIVQLFGAAQTIRWYRRLRASVLAAQSPRRTGPGAGHPPSLGPPARARRLTHPRSCTGFGPRAAQNRYKNRGRSTPAPVTTRVAEVGGDAGDRLERVGRHDPERAAVDTEVDERCGIAAERRARRRGRRTR